MSKKKRSDIEEFIALSDAEKDKVVEQYDHETRQESVARSRPLHTKEQQQWRRFKTKMGRPPVGNGAKTISLTVEKKLLEKADAYARQHRISRAKLVAKGLRTVLGEAA